MEKKSEIIDAILANPLYRPNSGLRRKLARALRQLSESDLEGLRLIIEAKGGTKLE